MNPMSASPYIVEIDGANDARWTEVIAQFDDAVLYQTQAFGAARRGTANLSHLVLKRGTEILACCQVSLHRAPWVNAGIADVTWGPLWRRKGGQPDPDVLLQLIRELKLEYGIKRRCLLRIWPAATGENKEVMTRILDGEGFGRQSSGTPYRTLLVDISPPLEALRSNLLQKWRNCLNKAERNGLNVIEGTSDELYGMFLTLADEMLDRKGFTSGVDYREYRRIQQNLPVPHKMDIMVCTVQGEPVCASIYSAMGDTGIYLLGATGRKALGLNGAYLLQWRMIERLKERGARYYDLGGIDPEHNPGVYKFKLGVAGRDGRDEEFPGEFHGCFTPQAKAVKWLLGGAKLLRRLRHRRSE